MCFDIVKYAEYSGCKHRVQIGGQRVRDIISWIALSVPAHLFLHNFRWIAITGSARLVSYTAGKIIIALPPVANSTSDDEVNVRHSLTVRIG